MIYLTGDTHIPIDVFKLNPVQWSEGQKLSKSDYLIILGDFGGLWFNDERDKEWLEVLHEQPWTTLFVDGNHENFDIIDNLPTVPMFGETVGKVNDSIFHLKRGCIYEIDGNKCFVMGGAESIDKHHRKINVSWWERELPSADEWDFAWLNLKNTGFDVDYVFTHTAPVSVLANHGIIPGAFCTSQKAYDITALHLEDIKRELQFVHWYHGHLHDNKTFGKFTCLYEDIIKLGEIIDE